MLNDARNLPASTVLEADVCIVGSGPAGLTIARELLGSGLTTIIVESGSLEPDDATQALAGGETTGEPFKALVETRARQFGGTANLWNTRWDPELIGFRGAPLDPLDFAARDWVPDSGWPFDREHLEPYYERAHAAAGMGPYAYDAARWARADAAPLSLGGDTFETSVWLFGAQRTFVAHRRAELEAAADTTILLNANVVELDTTDDASSVTAAKIVCLPDKALSVRARTFVVATGGIENARLLLLSRRVNPAGLGNEHDVVGRYFMEHQQVRAGHLLPSNPDLFDRMALYDERHVDGAPVMGQLHLTGTAMRRERLLNTVAAFLPLHARFRRFRWDSANALSELASGLKRGRLPERPLASLVEIARGGDFIAARLARRLSGGRLFRYWGEDAPTFCSGFGWTSLPDKAARFGILDVIMHAEQAPHRDNRVTLSAARDALGLPLPRLHWQWRPLDVESANRTRRLLAAELARAHVGRLDMGDHPVEPELISEGLHHHMGTTRMHRDPRHGVVDAQCGVHGVGNLFMAGCSVFPTGGYINPTLTIMALATRLADRLRQRSAAAAPAIATPI